MTQTLIAYAICLNVDKLKNTKDNPTRRYMIIDYPCAPRVPIVTTSP